MVVENTETAPTRRGRGPSRRAFRTAIATSLALDHDGVAHRAELRARGVTRADIRAEAQAGRWRITGRHTVQIGTGELSPVACSWVAVWESGSKAVLDGASALIAAGMTGYQPDVVHVTVPARSRAQKRPGVRLHRCRELPPTAGAGIPRIRPEEAAVRAARWARTDREAALLIALPVQQRLLKTDRLPEAAASVPGARGRLIRVLVRDVCDGAQSLGELDFAALCRSRGLPEPTRQAVRITAQGRAYLDAEWEEFGVAVEIDGSGHAVGLAPVEDALRQNEVTLQAERVLRLPLLALRIAADAFLDQVERALRLGGYMPRAA